MEKFGVQIVVIAQARLDCADENVMILKKLSTMNKGFVVTQAVQTSLFYQQSRYMEQPRLSSGSTWDKSSNIIYDVIVNVKRLPTIRLALKKLVEYI